MDISILICTRNSARRLRETLLQINRCRVPPGASWEVVVVNHKSSDETEQVAMEMQQLLPLKYVVEAREGLGQARNSALYVSSGSLAIFTDDDVKPDPGWIEVYWSAYIASPKGRFWGGPIESEFEGGQPNWELVQLGPPSIKGLDLGGGERCLLGDGIPLIAANWGCPSGPLKRAGGFDPQLGLNTAIGGGEETDLMRRLVQAGMEPWYLPTAKLRHIVPTSKVSLRHIANRRRAYGRFVMHNEIECQNRVVPLLGVPHWILRRLLETGAGWIFAKMTGRKGFTEYLNVQELLGLAEAARARGIRVKTRAHGRA